MKYCFYVSKIHQLDLSSLNIALDEAEKKALGFSVCTKSNVLIHKVSY